MTHKQKHEHEGRAIDGVQVPTEQNAPQNENAPKIMVALAALLVLTVFVQAFNFTQQSQINSQLENQYAALSPGTQSPNGTAIDMSGWTENEKMNYEMHGIIPARAAASAGGQSATAAPPAVGSIDVSPKGVPRVYGAELGVSFDDVSPNDPRKADETIAMLSAFDQEKSGKFIDLQGEKLQRYIKIASQISCEYCCGAQSIIFPNGQAACSCAHSYSMRGLAKYLLEKHPSEFTDDQILEELGKWKTLYFPGALSQKAQVLKDKGIELNYINLASNKYRGIEKGAEGGGPMVGGC